MNRNVPLKGIVAYPITPFDTNDHVDIKLYRQLLERLVTNGSHAIAPLGSAGVLPYLSDEEREQIAEATLDQVAGRLPVMVGVSALTTSQTIRHAIHAERIGAAAVMIIPMSYWKLSEDEIFDHYARIAASISIPIMAYNNPATAGTDMTPRFLARLLTIPNVTMIKESSGDVNRLHQLVEAAGDEVAFFNGSNPLAFSALVAGARGWCTAAANLIPELNVLLFEAICDRRDITEAKQVFHRQLPLLRFLVGEGLPRSVAAGLTIQGQDSGSLREPLKPLSAEKFSQLQQLLSEVNP